MRIILARHGQPDYTTDTLTEKGWQEAEALGKRAASWKVDRVYVSPLGRAKQTAEPLLRELGMEATELDWLREFAPRVVDPSTGIEHAAWDFQAPDFTADPMMMDPDFWWNAEIYKNLPDVKSEWERVSSGIDSIIAEDGYIRNASNPKYFDFVDPTGHVNPAEMEDIMLRGIEEYQIRDTDDEKTIVMVCHFGVSCVIAGHLLGISPVALWHGTCVPPTGLMILNAEKRLHNTAHFRIQALGDVSHLLAAGVPVSSYAAFSPVFQG